MSLCPCCIGWLLLLFLLSVTACICAAFRDRTDCAAEGVGLCTAAGI